MHSSAPLQCFTVLSLLLLPALCPVSALPALGLDLVGTLVSPLISNSNPLASTDSIINLGGSGDLIDVEALVNILGPSQCSANAVVGVFLEVDIPPLVHVCACIEVGNVLDSRKTKCPSCVANSVPTCSNGGCGCKCNDGYYSHTSGACLPISVCLSVGVLSSPDSSGASDCVCHSPHVADGHGGCKLPPSAHARLRSSRRAAKKSQLVLGSDATQSQHLSKKPFWLADATVETHEGSDAYKCPDDERACSVGDGEGYECLDVTTSLDSCGGCLVPSSNGDATGVNCLTLPGAVNVACVNSKCQIGSCFPGWRYLIDRCVRIEQ